MLAKLKTFSLFGIEALPVEVEVEVSPPGLPKQVLVGLPEAAVKESTHRVERSMVNSGFQRPQSRIAIKLAPAAAAGPSWCRKSFPPRTRPSVPMALAAQTLDVAEWGAQREWPPRERTTRAGEPVADALRLARKAQSAV